MIGELIPTGVTFGAGRISVNDQFSGTAEFNDVEVSGNLSAGTGGVIYSGGTDLYNIFSTSSGVDYWTAGTGTNSIAQVGGGNISSGITSVAEGTGTIAGGDFSHAEGNLTIASGQASHAEGTSTTAIGSASHAEGLSTIASGSGSHAEGDTTHALGIASHAEGYLTTASGDYSHAGGSNTIASGTYSFSSGINNISSGNASASFGGLISQTGYPVATLQSPAPTSAITVGSFAIGGNTLASGNNSFAGGSNTSATGRNSHSFGENTLASAQGSHAEGLSTIASGVYSHAEGRQTNSSGIYSHSEGYLTTASGNTSHAEGQNTIAGGSYSHAEGYSTIASGDNSHAGGNSSIASGNTSFIHSTNSLAAGPRSVVLGGQNITGTTADTVYVPYLNIQSLAAGTPVNNLGVDSGGNVVVGSAGGGNFLPLTITGTTIVNVDNNILYFTGNSATTIINAVVGSDSNSITQATSVSQAGAFLVSLNTLTGDSFYVSSNQLNGASLEYNSGSTVNMFKVTKSTMRASSIIPTFPGITYGGDYSSNYTNRSLVDKEYVDITVALGGGNFLPLTITGNTTISLSGTSTFVMSGDANDSEQIKIETNFLNNRPASLNIGKGSAALYSESGSSFANSYVSVSVSSAQIGRENGAVIQQISITDTEMKITDTVFAKGLIYDSNYHTNYTNRSLVDKEYVDIAVASGGGVNPYVNLGATGLTAINWNVSGLSTNYEVILSGDVSLNLTSVRNGEYGTIIVTQDSVGGRNLTFGTINGLAGTHKVVNGGGGAPTLTSTANAIDILSFTYNGSAMYWTVGNDYT